MINYSIAQYFQAAVYCKMQALITKYIWDEVILPLGVKVILIKWVFTYKEDIDGYIIKFKARLYI